MFCSGFVAICEFTWGQPETLKRALPGKTQRGQKRARDSSFICIHNTYIYIHVYVYICVFVSICIYTYIMSNTVIGLGALWQHRPSPSSLPLSLSGSQRPGENQLSSPITTSATMRQLRVFGGCLAPNTSPVFSNASPYEPCRCSVPLTFQSRTASTCQMNH